MALLKRYNFVVTRLNQIAAAHIPARPEWEVKCALSLHMWLDAEHAAGLRQRVAEMREPPHHLDESPDEGLEAWLEEVIRAEDSVELLAGIYRVVRPALIGALEKHLAETNPLADQPTCRVLRQTLTEQQEMVAWGRQAVTALSRPAAAAERARSWQAHLLAYLGEAGGIRGEVAGRGDEERGRSQQRPYDLQAGKLDDGHLEGTGQRPSELPAGRWAGRPYEMQAMPRRDSRISSSFDQSFSAGVSNSLSQELPADERGFILWHRRLQEMDVPEWMAPIIFKTEGKPWGYYREMSRQLWDEARHAMMGEVGLARLGIPFTKYPIALEGSTTLNANFEPLDSHILLWEVEQRLMQRTAGKRFELEMAKSSGDELLVLFQDYDWADEVLHAQIGRQWLIPDVGSAKALQARAQALRPLWHQAMERLQETAEPQNWWADFLAEARGLAAEATEQDDG